MSMESDWTASVPLTHWTSWTERSFQRRTIQKFLRPFYGIAYRDKNFVIATFMPKSSVQPICQRLADYVCWKIKSSLRRLVCYLQRSLPYLLGRRCHVMYDRYSSLPFENNKKSVITTNALLARRRYVHQTDDRQHHFLVFIFVSPVNSIVCFELNWTELSCIELSSV